MTQWKLASSEVSIQLRCSLEFLVALWERVCHSQVTLDIRGRITATALACLWPLTKTFSSVAARCSFYEKIVLASPSTRKGLSQSTSRVQGRGEAVEAMRGMFRNFYLREAERSKVGAASCHWPAISRIYAYSLSGLANTSPRSFDPVTSVGTERIPGKIKHGTSNLLDSMPCPLLS